MLRLGRPYRVLFCVALALPLFLYLLVHPLTILFSRDLTPSWVESVISTMDYPLSPKDEQFLASYTPKVPSQDLQTRLKHLLQAPVLNAADAFQQNAVDCPMALADHDQLWKRGWFWKRLRRRDIVFRRTALVDYLEDVGRKGRLFSTDPPTSRGIVMTGGNQDTTQRLLVTLRILREEYNCQLPVEIFSFPGEIKDPGVLQELASLSASVRILSGRSKQWRYTKNFQIKAESIVLSSFQEVLYLDSDNIPLRDPSYLFDTKIYNGPGQPRAVLWPDLGKDHPKNPIWRLLGKSCSRDEFQIESGQILIDKTGNNGLNMAALHVAAHMQEDHPFYFQLSEGDKDTFRYAFWALQLPFSVSPRWLSSLGFHAEWDNDRFCGLAMLQYDIDPPSDPQQHPRPLFVHANLLKHRERVPSTTLRSGDPDSQIIAKSPFAIIKRAENDLASAPSLDRVRMWVYKKQGMCVDLVSSAPSWPSSSRLDTNTQTIGSAGGGMGNGTCGANCVVEEKFNEVYDGVFANFTRMYLKYGGR